MSIDQLKPGQRAVVIGINARGALRQRLLDVGILRGITIDVERTGPGGHPLWIRCQGARLALRAGEATLIEVLQPID